MRDGYRLHARDGAGRATRRSWPLAAPESPVPVPRAVHGFWSSGDLAEEAAAMGQRSDRKDLGQGLAEIGKGPAGAEVDTGPYLMPGDQQRHVLACMIGAGRGRIVAVVGSHHEQIVATQLGEQRGKTN